VEDVDGEVSPQFPVDERPLVLQLEGVGHWLVVTPRYQSGADDAVLPRGARDNLSRVAGVYLEYSFVKRSTLPPLAALNTTTLRCGG
jgi:hypothetical protein